MMTLPREGIVWRGRLVTEHAARVVRAAAPQAVRFSLEVARGMDYIATHDMVHRDLAARNVLLSAKLECKVTDFGLARDVYEGDGQYIANAGYKQSNPTAWKWTSLEGLRQSTYTIEGDVWSYGVLLSEICSLGDTPYADVRQFSNDFLDFLKGGGRMKKGKHWSPILYSVMTDCWVFDPSERASFKVRVSRRQNLLAGRSGLCRQTIMLPARAALRCEHALPCRGLADARRPSLGSGHNPGSPACC